MKKIKFFALTIVMLAMMPSCHDKSSNSSVSALDSINNELNDSLATALAEKDSLMALMNDIADGMQQIKDMEEIVSAPNLSGETPDRKQQLRNDVTLIQQALELKRKRLEELEKRLTQSGNYNAETQKTIESLKKQLASQENTINSLKSQLAAAHAEIGHLNNRVDSLNTVNTVVKQEKKRAQEEAARVANELNTCFYAIGSKKELKAHKIIETGFLRKTKIMEGDYEKSYFTKADKRTLTDIQLHSNKAQVMSKHPADSYTILDGANGKVLHINNATKFWEVSNYLIIKVD